MSIKLEVTIMELENHEKQFKVTRRIPALSIADTKLFRSKEEAMKQFKEWLQ